MLRAVHFTTALIVFLSTPMLVRAQGAVHSATTETFTAQPDDVLIVHNDYGRVRIHTWPNAQIKAGIRRIALDEAQLDSVVVLSEKKANKVFFQSYFYNFRAESVYFDIQAPEWINVIVWGANPAVEIEGVSGYVRVQTLTGLITARDLTSSVSLLTEQGDIRFTERVQPERDIRLESIRGDILCEVDEGLSLRGWTRAGGTLSWNREIELEKGSLEKQVGTRGPLLYASSFSGNVEFRLRKPAAGSSLPAGTRSRPTAALPDPPDPADPVEVGQRAPDRVPAPAPGPAAPPPPTEKQTEISSTAARPTPSGDEKPVDGGYALSVNVDWIYLNVSVRDRSSNRSIAHLRKSDFQVYENDVLQKVEHFESTEAPFDLLLLLDVSGSTRSHMHLIKQASIDFTREIKSNDRIAVATFNSRTRLVQDFTNDRRRAAEAIRRIRSGGGTAFYDALEISIMDFMGEREGRKAVVVFTDGVDNQLTGDFGSGSKVTFEQLFREIQEVDTIIYTIFLDTDRGRSRVGSGGSVIDILGDILRGGTPPIIPGGSGSRGAYGEARRQLQKIADQTGGRMYSPGRIEDLAHVYSEIADDLRIQYRLGYNSTNPAQDGSWREIRVKVPSHRKATARTRRGYYARNRTS